MLERPLVPLDASPVAEQALGWANLMARTLHQPLILLSVVSDSEADQGLNPIVSAQDAARLALMRERETFARDYLDSVRARLEAGGVWSSIDVSVGAPAERIVSGAAYHQSGLIIMTTHARSAPERWFLGSVADRVLRTSGVPVLLVRPQPSDASIEPSLQHLVLPIDGSPAAEEAVPIAVYLAQTLKLPVTVVRAVDLFAMGARAVEPTIMELLESNVDEYLAEVVGRLRAEGVTAKAVRSYASAASAIEDAAAAPGSLIVMTPRGRSGLARALLGSVADRVIRGSSAPVLIVPPAVEAQ